MGCSPKLTVPATDAGLGDVAQADNKAKQIKIQIALNDLKKEKVVKIYPKNLYGDCKGADAFNKQKNK